VTRLALEWTLATTAAVVAAHLAIEIAGAAWLGYTLLFLLPLAGGAIGGLAVGFCQWLVIRRRTGDNGSWVFLTAVGFFCAWLLAMGIAAVLFVPGWGLTGRRAFASFAAATPMIGVAQSIALRRWIRRPRLWIAASTAGWSAFMAVEIFRTDALPAVDRLAGRIVSRVAGYDVASNVGSTLAAGVAAGAITGIALALLAPRAALSDPQRSQV
jgi:hypothetical protein